jgi:hypothetical protein
VNQNEASFEFLSRSFAADRYQTNFSDILHIHNRDIRSMAKRRGNPNWGKPQMLNLAVITPTSFELIVKELKLTPDQYLCSPRLREWALSNKNSKYIPETLLEAWALRSIQL